MACKNLAEAGLTSFVDIRVGDARETLKDLGGPVENHKKLKRSPITELADVITGFAFKSNEYINDSSEAVRLCRGANTLTGYLDWADTKFWPQKNWKN
ncbi:hypothetical protein [Escherichia albertii]|uniref:hypothetical protein n=1 Tax=Escherichia albertii TaxID=208962 RepID=UPI000B0F684F|nr:hypothetical protein [Escherichia albertii]